MKKFTNDYIKNIIETVAGYKLLSDGYLKNSKKVKIKCPKEHITNLVLQNFKRGCRCSHQECVSERNRKSQLLPINDVKIFIENIGYKLLDLKYNGSSNKHKIQCDKGHIFEMRISALKQGQRCPVCNLINKRNKYEDVKTFIMSLNYKLLSETYERALDNIKIQCDKGHIFEMKYNSLQQGQRCPKCSHQKMFSKGEKEVVKYIRSICSGKIIENDRNTIINPKTGRYLELDIYLPELNKAIEYNGEYWHNNNETKYKDSIKREYCKNNNIELLVINENKNVNNYNIIKGFIYGT